ncbi:MAG: flagellar protein FlbB [Xanthobacteraceae bacterium]|jgi:flagellar motility protein MotE (MotC chaperone)
MIGFLRDLRLIPIALIASVCLLTLKTADLVLNSPRFAAGDNAPAVESDVSVTRPIPDATQPPGSVLSWAQQMFNFPDGSGVAPVPSRAPSAARQLAERDSADITGSVATEPAAGAAKTPQDTKSPPDAKNPPETKSAPDTKNADGKSAAVPLGKDGKPLPQPEGISIPADGAAVPTGAERAILARLQDRRQELDTRARELDIRENLIQSAEKRVEARLNELKDVEARIKVETQQKDDAEASRLKGLVTMYETMKPRDAAKIFNGLDSDVLLEVVSRINPRQMSEILAQMSADVAQHLTIELASKARQAKVESASDLPKIQGQSIAQ